MSPDERTAHFRRQKADRKQAWRALGQCDTCGLTATPSQTMMPAYQDSDRRWRHRGCNGLFVGFAHNAQPSRSASGTVDGRHGGNLGSLGRANASGS